MHLMFRRPALSLTDCVFFFASRVRGGISSVVDDAPYDDLLMQRYYMYFVYGISQVIDVAPAECRSRNGLRQEKNTERCQRST